MSTLISDRTTVILARCYCTQSEVDSQLPNDSPNANIVEVAQSLRRANNEARAFFAAESTAPLGAISAHMREPMPSDAAIRRMVQEFAEACPIASVYQREPGSRILADLMTMYAPVVNPPAPQKKAPPPADEIF